VYFLLLPLTNTSSEVYFDGLHTLPKHILCNFSYLTGRDVYLLWIQIQRCIYKQHRYDTALFFLEYSQHEEMFHIKFIGFNGGQRFM